MGLYVWADSEYNALFYQNVQIRLRVLLLH